jgi:hypothetical protein
MARFIALVSYHRLISAGSPTTRPGPLTFALPTQDDGSRRRIEVLGGLSRDYRRAAAWIGSQ